MSEHPTPPCTRMHNTARQPRNHHAEWLALNFAQQEAQARDLIMAMLDSTPWNSPEFLALSHAAAVLTVQQQQRRQAQGGAA